MGVDAGMNPMTHFKAGVQYVFKRGTGTPIEHGTTSYVVAEGMFPSFQLDDFIRLSGQQLDAVPAERFSSVPLSAAHVETLCAHDESIVLIPRVGALEMLVQRFRIDATALSDVFNKNVILPAFHPGFRMVVEKPALVLGTKIDLPGFETHTVRKVSLATLVTYLYWKNKVMGVRLEAPYYRARRFGENGCHNFGVACQNGQLRIEPFTAQRGWVDVFEIVPRHWA